MTRRVSLSKKIEDYYNIHRSGLSPEENQLAQYVAKTLSSRGYSHSVRLDKVTQRLNGLNYLETMSEEGLKCINGLLERHYIHLKENSASTKERNRRGLSKEFTESRKIRNLGLAGMRNYRLRNNLTERIQEKIVGEASYSIREIPLELPSYILEDENREVKDPYNVQMTNRQAMMFSQAFIDASFGRGAYLERERGLRGHRTNKIIARAKNFAKAALVLIPLALTSCFSNNRNEESNIIEPTKMSVLHTTQNTINNVAYSN